MMASYPPGTRGPQGFNINQTSHICYVKSNKEWYVFFPLFLNWYVLWQWKTWICNILYATSLIFGS